MTYETLLAELKVIYRDAVPKIGEAEARRAFMKATVKPPVGLVQRGQHGVQHWAVPERELSDHVPGSQWEPPEAA